MRMRADSHMVFFWICTDDWGVGRLDWIGLGWG